MSEWSYSTGELPVIAGSSVVAFLSGDGAENYARRLLKVVPTADSLAEVLDQLVAEGELKSVPAFFIGTGVGASLRAIVRGGFSIEARTTHGESVTFGGSTSRTWSEVIIDDVETARIGPTANPSSTPGLRALRPGPHGASSLHYAPAPAPAPAPPTDHNLTLAPEPPFELVAPPAPAPIAHGSYDALFGQVTVVGAIEGAAVREENGEAAAAGAHFDPEFDSASMSVSAILCPQDHPNPPERTTCWTCMAALSAGVVQRMPRPTLGRIVLGDGREVRIKGTILIGRSPRAERTDSSSIPELVVVQSPNNDVSRTHARLFIEGWQVLLEDLGSTNGTLITSTAGTERRIRAGEPAILVDGSLVDLGDGARFTVVGVP